MFPLHELHDVSEIVSMDVEMLLRTGKGQAPGCVWSEIAEVPPFDKLAESGNPRMLFQ